MTAACARCRELAPELALGVLDGDDRAEALRHLATCAECRAFADQLADVADSLLLLTPAADPPLGFESRVAGRLARENVSPVALAPPSRRSGRGWWRTAAAAVAAAAVAAVAAVVVVGTGERDQLVNATLASVRSGDAVGRVWAYDAHGGGRDWVFMTIDNPWAADNPYVCEAVLEDGRTIRLGRFVANDGKGAWGEPVSVAVGAIAEVRVLTDSGDVVAAAALDD